ncbi:unnamed protein product [Ixodes pacificus]
MMADLLRQGTTRTSHLDSAQFYADSMKKSDRIMYNRSIITESRHVFLCEKQLTNRISHHVPKEGFTFVSFKRRKSRRYTKIRTTERLLSLHKLQRENNLQGNIYCTLLKAGRRRRIPDTEHISARSYIFGSLYKIHKRRGRQKSACSRSWL